MQKSSIIYISVGIIITAAILAWQLIPLLTKPPVPKVTWTAEAKDYPIVDVYLASGMPPTAIQSSVPTVQERAEKIAAKSDFVVDVADLREAIAIGFQERYPDRYPTMEDAYMRLEELEAMVGYTPP